jgi:hypothetical protein
MPVYDSTSNIAKAAWLAASTSAAYTATQPIDVVAMGGLGDTWAFTDGTITANHLNQITFVNTGWKSTAVTPGNSIKIVGAGVGGIPLSTTIVSVSGATITFAAPASQAVANTRGDFGTNETALIQEVLDLAVATGRPIDLGPSDMMYYLDGPSYYYPEPGVSQEFPQGFTRGLLYITGSFSMYGNKSGLFLSGGRFNPGGIFFQNVYTAEFIPIDYIFIDNIILDNNADSQYTVKYTSTELTNGWNSTSNGAVIWQWDYCIYYVGVKRFIMRDCIVRNSRGNAVGGGSYIDSNNVVTYPTEYVEITGCEFYNHFMNAFQGDGYQMIFENNYFHGNGYWVGVLDFETNATNIVDTLSCIRVRNNRFDMRDGLAPPERCISYDVGTPQSIAAQIHLRRWLTGGGWSPSMPNNIWNGNLFDVVIDGNEVFQGVMDLAGYSCLYFTNNTITNFHETIVGSQPLIHAEAVIFTTNTAYIPNNGFYGLSITNNRIVSPLDSRAISIHGMNNAHISENYIKGAKGAGIRLEVASGHIVNNQIVDVGSSTSGDAADIAGISVYGTGSQPLTISGNQVIDTRGVAYVSAPSMDFSEGSGTGASATAVITGGIVTGYTNLVGGSGYTENFTVYFWGGGGSGATATAIVSGGAVTSVSITYGGGQAILQLIAYPNVAISPICVVTENVGMGFNPQTAYPDGVWNQYKNTFSHGNYFDTGSIQTVSTPTSQSVGGDLTITGNQYLGDYTGSHDGSITLKRGSSGVSKILMVGPEGLEYQIFQTEAGGVGFQSFVNGVFQHSDLIFSPDGKMFVNWTWDHPVFIQRAPVGSGTGVVMYLWIDANGMARSKDNGPPSNDLDGFIGWGVQPPTSNPTVNLISTSGQTLSLTKINYLSTLATDRAPILPPSSGLSIGSLVSVRDLDYNAATVHQTIHGAGSDTIVLNGATATASVSMTTNGEKMDFVLASSGVWKAIGI